MKGKGVNNPKNLSTWFMDVPYGGKRSATLVMKLSHYVISSNIILHTPFILTLILCKDSCKSFRGFYISQSVTKCKIITYFLLSWFQDSTRHTVISLKAIF